ncbi:MAG: DNA adenine methylase [Thermoplasmataceae archaeon]
MLKPILKWAGGKRQLLPVILNLIPPKFNAYHEPFFGGGALFFELSERSLINTSFISDLNQDLIELYSYIKNSPELVIESIKNLGYHNEKESYYNARNEFNTTSDSLKKASLLLYLNRHCFNGLYRVNSSGGFNVPFGKYNNPHLPEEDIIYELSKALQGTSIRCIDFEKAMLDVQENDLVYLDPPYHPLSDTSFFTSYNASGFGEEEQKRLFSTFKAIDSRGALIILSNSDSPFIRELYSEFNVKNVEAFRYINSDKTGRKGTSELIISNFV